MKLLVGKADWPNIGIGVAAVLFALIVQAETLMSYVILLGLLVTMAWQAYTRRFRADRQR